MNCPKCQKELIEGSRVCAHCGHYMPQEKSRPSLCQHCAQPIEAQDRYCPHCGAEQGLSATYQKPHTTCRHCEREIAADQRYCPYCGGDQKKEVILPAKKSALRFMGPVLSLILLLAALSAGLYMAYGVAVKAYAKETVLTGSLSLLETPNTLISQLKEAEEYQAYNDEAWDRLRSLLSDRSYVESAKQALREARKADFEIVAAEKKYRVIQTYKLHLNALDVEVRATDTPIQLTLGDIRADIAKGATETLRVLPGIYRIQYDQGEAGIMTQSLPLSLSSRYMQGGVLRLEPRVGSVIPVFETRYPSARILVNGQDSTLRIRDLIKDPQRIGLHAAGTLFRLEIDTKLGIVTSTEVPLVDQTPLGFQLVNGVVLAQSVDSDIILVNGEKKGTYAEFAASDHVIGPIDLAKDKVRIQGSGTDMSPLEKSLAESIGKSVDIALSEELKKEFIAATKTFCIDAVLALQSSDMAKYTNIQVDSETYKRLQVALKSFVDQKKSVDYTPFALRFTNDSFKVYARDGTAYAEFIETYYTKNSAGKESSTSWQKYMVYDGAQLKWLFYKDEILQGYKVPKDNTLIYFN